MKICMIGLGSMGARHLRNLALLCRQEHMAVQFDALRSSSRQLEDDHLRSLLHSCYSSADEMPDDYDIVFIVNPTNMHFDTIKATLGKTRHMFIEKPVFEGPRRWEDLEWRKDGIYYVACPLRHHSVIQYLKTYTEQNRVHAVRGICSSYLPDWRPGADYRTSYSARKEMGGGVRVDLIHEWDYLRYLFGDPLSLTCVYGKNSGLEITSEDTAVYLAKYPDKLISLHLDYLGRHTRREIELFCEDEVVVGDLVNHEVRFLRSGEIIPLPQERDEMQLGELRHFFRLIDRSASNDNGVEYAVQTLKITLGEW